MIHMRSSTLEVFGDPSMALTLGGRSGKYPLPELIPLALHHGQ